MDSLLHRSLIVVTGKGGVGKTTIAAAVGLLASRQGLRTLVVDLSGASRRLRQLLAGDPHTLGQEPDAEDEPRRLDHDLWALSLDSDVALMEWMQALGGRIPARMLASRSSFQYFAAAAPGAKELVCIVKIWRLATMARQRGGYDLVVFDAPATGHALAMLSSPRTFASIARVGPVAAQAEEVRQMLEDPTRTGYLAVAQASEMAVSETLDLQRDLRDQMGVDLSSVIVNATLHRRFTGEELQRIEALRGQDAEAACSRVAHAAAAAANAAHARTRFQHNQIARLRRHGLTVLQVPLVFQRDLDRDALSRIAERLQGNI